jgi:hypothetical protein
MDKQEAMDLMAEELGTWRDKTYSELSGRVGESHRFERIGPSGTRYQGNVALFWDDKPDEDVRVIASIDDGGWRSALLPLSDSFILSKTGRMVGE